MSALEDRHQIALARELTYAAGCPLRNRYGYAARDEDILTLLYIISAHPDDSEAGDTIGIANACGRIEIAEEGCDMPVSEEYEQNIITALRPLVRNNNG